MNEEIEMKLPKVYEPAQYENDVYKLWELSGAFAPKGNGTPFTILMPPPNANANLHVGHTLGNSIQDILTRYHRMKGDATLWLPGADHAGFETWVVFEKHLNKAGKTRFDFTREELYQQVWDFVQLNKTNFESQFRALGASCDWSRFTFTLDNKVVKTAYQTFQRLWDDKLIYRGERLVNYCTLHGTSFADIEVEYKDRTTPLYYLRYGPLELATTRPETKFGDTAVAVHPDDNRYKKYVGQTITVEGLNGPFELRVVADEMVDPKFGTGAVKVTPAHDFNDWEVAQRHNLPAVRVINHDGTMNKVAGQFEGMSVEEARQAVVLALKEKDLLVKVDEHYKNRVGVCYKCGTVIEPMLLDQWFIRMQPLAEQAIEALEKGTITFYPASKKKILIDYLRNIKDWNISRQIPWGIPIPAFQNIDDSDDWIFNDQVKEHTIERDGKTYRRDPDVFDTWFSSGQWPYITLDYPDGKDFSHFYPTTFMDTAGEILFAWVARMIMLGLYVTNEVPFKDVYIHGNVKASDGTKMSKSKGNTVDPMEVIEKYGSDAVRLGITSGRTAGVHQAYTETKIVGGRNFCNKLWNIARFIEGAIPGDFSYQSHPDPRSNVDHWILDRSAVASKEVGQLLDEYQFALALERVQQFVWEELADWYIEASKDAPNTSVLAYILEQALRLCHPFAPFVTETIWQTLAWEPDSLLMTRDWPTSAANTDGDKVATFERLRVLVNDIRQLSVSAKLQQPTLSYIHTPDIAESEPVIKRLAGVTEIIPVQSGDGLQLLNNPYTAWLSISEDALESYHERLKHEESTAKKAIESLQKRLANKAYVKSAPQRVVDQSRDQLENAKEQFEKVRSELHRFK